MWKPESPEIYGPSPVELEAALEAFWRGSTAELNAAVIGDDGGGAVVIGLLREVARRHRRAEREERNRRSGQ